jgi:hypothetical protein
MQTGHEATKENRILAKDEESENFGPLARIPALQTSTEKGTYAQDGIILVDWYTEGR